jgi:hypothetical protein
MIVVKSDNSTTWAFVPWPLAVTHPDYQPKRPPESIQPGEWVVIVYGGSPANAWVPSTPSSTPPPETEAPPEVQPVA